LWLKELHRTVCTSIKKTNKIFLFAKKKEHKIAITLHKNEGKGLMCGEKD